MKFKHNVDELARRQVRKLVAAKPSDWDEVIVAYAKSDHVSLPELLDMVMDITRMVHGVAYHPRQNERILDNVLAELDRRHLYRSNSHATVR